MSPKTKPAEKKSSDQQLRKELVEMKNVNWIESNVSCTTRGELKNMLLKNNFKLTLLQRQNILKNSHFTHFGAEMVIIRQPQIKIQGKIVGEFKNQMAN